MSYARILLVHPEPWAVATLESMLRPLRGVAVEAADDRTALRLLATCPGLVLQGVDPADPDALELLTYTRRHHAGLPVILLVSSPHPELARRACQLGAAAVLRFPLPAGELRDAVARALAAGEAEHRPGEPTKGPAGAPVHQPTASLASSPSTCSCHIRPAVAPGEVRPLYEALDDCEREILAQALRAFGGCRQRTARALGINRTTLYNKLKKHGLSAE